MTCRCRRQIKVRPYPVVHLSAPTNVNDVGFDCGQFVGKTLTNQTMVKQISSYNLCLSQEWVKRLLCLLFVCVWCVSDLLH